jgi:hypothetical protein
MGQCPRGGRGTAQVLSRQLPTALPYQREYAPNGRPEVYELVAGGSLPPFASALFSSEYALLIIDSVVSRAVGHTNCYTTSRDSGSPSLQFRGSSEEQCNETSSVALEIRNLFRPPRWNRCRMNRVTSYSA